MNDKSIVEQVMKWLAPWDFEHLAREHEWLKRQGKIDPMEFVISLTCGQMSALGLSLNAQSQSLSEPVSPQALDQRYNPAAVKYFKACFDQTLQRSLSSAGPGGMAPAEQLRRHFCSVYLNDSTSFDVSASLQEIYPACGGDGSSANVKVLLRYEVLGGQFEPLNLLPGKRSDQGLASKLAQQLRPGELQISDTAFGSAAAWRIADQGHAYLLSPVAHSVSVWMAQGAAAQLERLDLAKILSHTQENCCEWPALYLGQDSHRAGPVRVAAFRLSPESAGRRRAALRESMRKQGRTPSQESLELAGWLILATNASPEQLPTPMMAYLYRLRWQVELVFRQCKSVLRLDQSQSDNPSRIQCEIWARLLAAVVIFAWHAHAQAVCWATHGCEASFEKVSRLFQQWGHTLARAFWQGADCLRQTLQSLWRFTLKLARKGRQKTRTNTWDKLWELWLKGQSSTAGTAASTADCR
jgi:hypothetical protein